MKVNMMRNIDRFLGPPLCFLLTLLLRPWWKLTKSSAVNNKVLFIELSEMGSAILADPAMRQTQKSLTAELYFVIFEQNKPSLDLLATIAKDNIFTIRSSCFRLFITDVIRFFIWARKNKIQTVVDFELYSRATMILSALSGAKRRVGFYRFYQEGLYRGNLLTHKVAYNPYLHISQNFLALVNALTAASKQRPFVKQKIERPKLAKAVINPAQQQEVNQALEQLGINANNRQILLFNANASDLLIHRRWPAKHFAALAARVVQHFDQAFILFTGAPNESAFLQSIVDAVDHPRCINFAGKVSFAALPALYNRAEVLLSNDSGPAHFAATTDCKTLVLFGPETAAMYLPLGNSYALSAELACSPCVSAANHRKTACRDNVCMQVISVDKVFTHLVNLVSSKKSQSPPAKQQAVFTNFQIDPVS